MKGERSKCLDYIMYLYYVEKKKIKIYINKEQEIEKKMMILSDVWRMENRKMSKKKIKNLKTER